MLDMRFAVADARVIILDTDIVLVFADGGKVILPNLALDMTTGQSPDLKFVDQMLDSVRFMAQVGDVKLADAMPAVQLSSAPAEGQGTPQPAAPPQPAPPPPQPTARPQMENEFTGRFREEAPPPNTSRMRLNGEDDAPPVSPGSPPVKPAIDDAVGDNFGRAPISQLEVRLFGVPGLDSEGLPGGGQRLFGKGGIAASATDDAFAVQSSRETITGSGANDVIYADDPNLMPPGTFVRRLEVSIEFPEDGWKGTAARIIGLPEGFAVTNGVVVDGAYLVEMDPDNSPETVSFDLRYVLPPDGTQPDPQGFLSTFGLQVQFFVDKGNGDIALINGQRTFGIKEVLTEDDASYRNPLTGEDYSVLPSNPAGAVIDAGGGDDTVYAGAGYDQLEGGSGFDVVGFVQSRSAVTVDLGAGTNSGGAARNDIITGFEGVIGSAYDDSLTGSAGDNLFTGGTGADRIDGGAGIDTAEYSASAQGVTVDLATGTASGGEAQGDTLLGIENVGGSAQADRLIGDAQANVLTGRGGADTLIGGGGRTGSTAGPATTCSPAVRTPTSSSAATAPTRRIIRPARSRSRSRSAAARARAARPRATPTSRSSGSSARRPATCCPRPMPAGRSKAAAARTGSPAAPASTPSSAGPATTP